jgi:hypothetical protein
MLKRPNQLIWLSLALGWVFDLLFWKKPMGISFAIYVALTLSVGFVFARQEEIKPARTSVWLALPIAFFTIMSVIRLEPMTTFLNRSLALLLMMMLASTFQGGRWPLYQLWDYFIGLGTVIISALSRAGINILSTPKSEEDDKKDDFSFKRAVPVLRGIILALPVVLLFGALLSSADPVFSRVFNDILELFQIDKLAEYIVRGILILMIAYLLFGVYMHVYAKSDDKKLATQKTRLKPFLGFVEAAIILGSVAALFSVFVVIQFQYFFGGQANINIEGFTYSEYARRGVFELVVVAFFTLMLFLLMSAVTRRGEERQQKIFSGLGITLVLLVAVILVSAFQRLILYEHAFGFTRLRTYSHVFMLWVGALLVATAALEALGRQRIFVFAALMSALGFTASLNLLNVDAFIAWQNINRLDKFEEVEDGYSSRMSVETTVDISYLASLSTDAVPVMSALLTQAHETDDLALLEVAGQALACHAEKNKLYEYELPWQSINFSKLAAAQAWNLRAQEALHSAQIECDSD